MNDDLIAGLQRLADRADTASLPPPRTIRAAGERRTRRTALGIAGLTVAAVVTAAGVVNALTGSSQHDAPPPSNRTPTPTVTGTPTPPSVVNQGSGNYGIEPGWGERTGPHAIAALGSRFVIVADNSWGDGANVWWSDDGWTWTAASGAPASFNVTDVIATDDGLLATGVGTNGAAAVFRSEDGETWQQPAATPKRSNVDALWGINHTERGYFAWGFVGRAPVLLRSPDGHTWTATDLAAAPGRETDTSLCWVEDSDTGGLTATGYVQDGRLGPQHRATWTSTDGTTWTRSVEAEQTNMTVACNDFWERHWSASTEAGTVRIEPYGDNRIYFTPAG
jgi:hypothetical protein